MATYKELVQERIELDKQIAAARRAETAWAIKEAKRLISEYDLKLKDCGFIGFIHSEGSHEKTWKPIAVKYCGPEGQTWTGRGRAPNWLASLEAQGRDRSEFLV